jgi:hypothetical protein
MDTTVISTDPAIVRHELSSFSDDAAITRDVANAVAVVEQAAQTYGTLALLLDFSRLADRATYRMSAHRIWAVGFKENDSVRRHIRNVAVVANDSPKFRAEKEVMETDTQRYFTDAEEAVGWLKSIR